MVDDKKWGDTERDLLYQVQPVQPISLFACCIVITGNPADYCMRGKARHIASCDSQTEYLGKDTQLILAYNHDADCMMLNQYSDDAASCIRLANNSQLRV